MNAGLVAVFLLTLGASPGLSAHLQSGTQKTPAKPATQQGVIRHPTSTLRIPLKKDRFRDSASGRVDTVGAHQSDTSRNKNPDDSISSTLPVRGAGGGLPSHESSNEVIGWLDRSIGWIIFLLEIIGLSLLAREVRRGHNMERLEKKTQYSRRMLFFYTARDYSAMMIEHRLAMGDTIDQAREWVDLSGPDAIAAAAENEWAVEAPGHLATLREFDKKTSPRVHKSRRRDLIAGTAILMTAAALRLLEHPR